VSPDPLISIFLFSKQCSALIFSDCVGCCLARLNNVFVIGKGNKPWVSLPRGKGVRLTIAEERDRRIQAKAQ